MTLEEIRNAFFDGHKLGAGEIRTLFEIIDRLETNIDLQEEIWEALAHPIGDDSSVRHPIAVQVLEYVKGTVDFNLRLIEEKDQWRTRAEKLEAALKDVSSFYDNRSLVSENQYQIAIEALKP